MALVALRSYSGATHLNNHNGLYADLFQHVGNLSYSRMIGRKPRPITTVFVLIHMASAPSKTPVPLTLRLTGMPASAKQ